VIQRLADELTLAGYQPFHTPSAMLPGQRRADADLIAVRPVLGLLNVTIRVGEHLAARLGCSAASQTAAFSGVG
jgi:hypothetical protein